MSPWAWLGFTVVAVVVLGILVFVITAAVAAIRDAQSETRKDDER